MILLMGIVGSGKGTQGKMLADQHGFHLISTGEVLRMYATETQQQRMLAGGLLDDQEIIDMVDNILNTLPDKREIIFDGFPRSIPQAEWVMAQTKTGRLKLTDVFNLVASRQAVKSRLLSRGRLDDKEDVIEERFNEYERSTAPLLAWFKENGITVHNVNAERPIEVVNAELVALVAAAQNLASSDAN